MEVESLCRHYTLLHVNFHKLDRCVHRCILIRADPDLQVISGGLGEGLAEPWRVVECAACAGGTTPSTIPQWVIREKVIWGVFYMITGITEVIISNERC